MCKAWHCPTKTSLSLNWRHGFDRWTFSWKRNWLDGHIHSDQQLDVQVQTNNDQSFVRNSTSATGVKRPCWWHGQWNQLHPWQVCWQHQAVMVQSTHLEGKDSIQKDLDRLRGEPVRTSWKSTHTILGLYEILKLTSLRGILFLSQLNFPVHSTFCVFIKLCCTPLIIVTSVQSDWLLLLRNTFTEVAWGAAAVGAAGGALAAGAQAKRPWRADPQHNKDLGTCGPARGPDTSHT